MVPPLGLYEHKFNKGVTHTQNCKKSIYSPNYSTAKNETSNLIDMRFINKPIEKEANK